MTVATARQDIGDAIEEVSKRLYRLEQLVSSPTVMGGSGGTIGSNPSVNSITVGGVLLSNVSSAPTGLSLSTGSFMEDIWIDASWTPPSDGTAAGFDVELAKKTGVSTYSLQQTYHAGGTSIRMAGLEPQATYGVRVISVNKIGVRSTPLPATGFQDITTGVDATVPSQVSGVSMAAGFKTVTIRWNEVSDRDVAKGSGQYRVELATDSAFTQNYKTQYVTGTVCSFGDLTTNTTYYARVTAIDNSGNSGTPSATVSATTGFVGNSDLGSGSVGTTQIQDAAITNAKIANLAVDDAKIASLDAGKINVGTLSAGRIAANSIDVNKLQSSTMTTVTLTVGAGGAIKVGNPPTTGLLINDQGLRLYNGGNVKVALDVAGTANFTGTISASSISSTTINGGTITGGAISGGTIDGVTITGTTISGGTITGATVRTASSGKRVAIEAGDVDMIKFYSGDAGEAVPGEINIGAGSGGLLELGMYAPKFGSGGNAKGSLQMGTHNTLGGEGYVQLKLIAEDQSTAKGVIQFHGSVTNGWTGSIAYGDSFTIFVKNNASVFNFTQFNAVTSVFAIYSPNNSAAALSVYNLEGNKILVTAFDGNGYAGIKASAFELSSGPDTKEDVQDAGPALATLRKLRTVTFQRPASRPLPPRLRSDPHSPPHDPGHPVVWKDDSRRWGLMAPEVQKVFPEGATRTTEGTPSGVDIGSLVGLLVRAVQELSDQVEKMR